MTIDLKAIEERLQATAPTGYYLSVLQVFADLCREDAPALIAAVKERDADAKGYERAIASRDEEVKRITGDLAEYALMLGERDAEIERLREFARVAKPQIEKIRDGYFTGVLSFDHDDATESLLLFEALNG
jgi:hypothetical protein